MTRRTAAALALACVVLGAGSACRDEKEVAMAAKPSLQQMTAQLRECVDELAAELGTTVETRRDTVVSGLPPDQERLRWHEYVVAVRVSPGADLLTDRIVDRMRQQGWNYTRRSSSSHQFEKDGYNIAVMFGERDVATVGGSTPYVTSAS